MPKRNNTPLGLRPLPANLTCKYCGCTQLNPCLLDDTFCEWVIVYGQPAKDPPLALITDPRDNVCSNPECIQKCYQELLPTPTDRIGPNPPHQEPNHEQD